MRWSHARRRDEEPREAALAATVSATKNPPTDKNPPADDTLPTGRSLPTDRNRPPRGNPPAHPAVRALAMLAAFAGTVAFSVVLARLTLEPSAASAALVHSNLRPGSSIEAYLEHASTLEAARQLGGNLLLGVPFGVLLPVLLPPARGLLRVAAVTVCLMTMVELVQGALVTGRVFDIDDVILNTAGALLGYLFIGLRLGRAVHPRRRHWWHRRPS
ncbi:VanZ family protein [Streptomyces erythrochromogenes]|uniref:VanZ family protein n=1 Tax=Streptomyces erythrochromogenes TaxID=285574 RepID=UPI0037F1FCB0